MRVPVYFVCAALIVAVKTDKSAIYSETDQLGTPLERRTGGDSGSALDFLVPRLMLAKYRQMLEENNRQWGSPYDPYAYSDIDTNNIDDQLTSDERNKRGGVDQAKGQSLSISNSLDVLRNRLLLEISRKKTMEGMNRNRGLLCKIGKRAVYNSKKCDVDYIY